jgi:hypothetical protein
MGKLWRAALVASLVIGSIGFIALPAAQAAPALCTGFVQNFRFAGDVEVPNGATCTLSNVIVGNRVLVDPGGNLALVGTTVAGNLNATSPASIRIDSLPSSCTAGPPPSCSQPSIVRGTAVIDGTTGVPSGLSTNLICNGTKFSGDSFTLKNSAAAAPYDVGGGTCSFGGNQISGVARITGNAGYVTYANNRSGDNLAVNTNTGGGSLVNNHSGGSILCGGGSNVPAYTASGNSAAFADQSRFGTC